MRFRCIGPPRGGRVVAVAGDPVEPAVFYFGAVAGGVWKTEDAGTTWRNISDGYLQTASVGALTVSDSDPNIIYAGMGETTIRNDVSHGDGVYRSTDAGKSWTHLGLEATRHISEIRVHPKNADLVYVAAFGHAFGRNDERGVFRTSDGGRNWERVLYKSDKAGVGDLTLDPNNPEILYASIYETQRSFWGLTSGGPDSGLWRSTDGGDSWTEITPNQGLPRDALLGKIGLSASPAQAGRVWALIESSVEPGLYRSDDFGDTWNLITDKQEVRYRPWYYLHVFADPQDAETLYINNDDLWRSNDGGRSFSKIATPHGDNHDLWIDPRDNRRMIQSNDGGANVSFDRGASWTTIYNQLTAQIYTVTTDNREPHYRVYGTQQDNSSISVPSSTTDGAITWADCYPAGTGESGDVEVHPANDDVLFVGAVGSSPGGGGTLQRYDHRSGQIRLVNVWAEAFGGMGPEELRYRFPWTFPILFSPHDAEVLYTSANVIFRSRDEGHSWEVISPDLTRNDVSKLGPSGGPITRDTSGAEHYCTIHTLRESPHEAGVLWCGSDDGLVHLSRDGGASWKDVTPPDLPEWSFIRTVEPSPQDPATLYLAATRYKHDDPAPYLYKTTDYGESWQKITDGIPDDDFTRVIRADPARPGILYAGTETSLHVSLDDGTHWMRWRSNLPVAPIYDLTIKGSDLVVATHGRSFWIMDDLTPLHQLQSSASDGAMTLYAPRSTWRLLPDIFEVITSIEGKDYNLGLSKPATYLTTRDENGLLERKFLDAGQGAPAGAIVYYHLPEDLPLESDAALVFLDADDQVVRELRPKPTGRDRQSEAEQALDPGPWMPTRAGVNRFVWDLRYPGATRLLGNKTGEEANRGPLVLPGTYRVRLTVGNETLVESFEIVNDPRSPASLSDLREQLTLLLRIRDKLSETYSALEQLRDVMAQIQGLRTRLEKRDGHDSICAAAEALEAKLAIVESALVMPGEQIDVLGLHERVRLNAALATVISVVESADYPPTTQASELAEHYMTRIDTELAVLGTTLEKDLAALNQLVDDSHLPAILLSS